MILVSSVCGASQPHNEIRVEPQSRYDNGYSEERYNYILSRLKHVFEPHIAKLGGQLVVLDDWSDGAVNMWAWRVGDEYVLEIPGGYSRFYLINESAFLLTICHELGHLLGGDPSQDQISYEGQSDYYSAGECAKLLFSAIDRPQAHPISSEVKSICGSQPNLTESSLCERILEGGLSATAYYAELEGTRFPKYSTPSSERVKKTISTHPSAQCRLDTIFTGFHQTPRPNCWYFGQSN